MTDELTKIESILRDQMIAFNEIRDLVSAEAFLIFCQKTPLGRAYNDNISALRMVEKLITNTHKRN